MLLDKLIQHQNENLTRIRFVRNSAQGLLVNVEGCDALNFSSNDYLGFANHPEIKKSMINAVERYGVGSGASQMISGYHALQQEFEKQIAAFLGFDAALVFSSGYLANIGVMMCFGELQTEFFADKQIHASLLDGIHASRGKLNRFLHLNVFDLNRRLQLSCAKQKVIVTEGVFSMDGAIAPLTELARLANALIIDDAHGIGVLGEIGRGAIEYTGISQHDITCLIGTLGKSFGVAGAFVCGNSVTIEYLKQFARTGIYSTAVMPCTMAGALTSLQLIQQSEQRKRLHEVIHYFNQQARRKQLSFINSNTPIQSMIIRNNQKTMKIQTDLLNRGFWVGAIRPPTVLKNTARIRVSLNAEHQPQQIDGLLNALSEIVHE